MTPDRPPPPRIALRREEAAQALGISDESFDKYVRPHVRVLYLGALKLWPLAELERFAMDESVLPLRDEP